MPRRSPHAKRPEPWETSHAATANRAATEPPRRFTKDQERARRAYERAAAVTNDRRKDYKIAVVAFGANILRSGLSAALADLIRRKACGVLADIVRFDIPGLEPVPNGDPLFMRVNNLAVGEYMLVTRECSRSPCG